jgi:hypothetical protein
MPAKRPWGGHQSFRFHRLLGVSGGPRHLQLVPSQHLVRRDDQTRLSLTGNGLNPSYPTQMSFCRVEVRPSSATGMTFVFSVYRLVSRRCHMISAIHQLCLQPSQVGSRAGAVVLGPGSSRLPAAFATRRCLSPSPHSVSNSRHVVRSMRISRTTHSCPLHAEVYATYQTGSAFNRSCLGRWTR